MMRQLLFRRTLVLQRSPPAPGNTLNSRAISRQVLPAAPSPTRTHLTARRAGSGFAICFPRVGIAVPLYLWYSVRNPYRSSVRQPASQSMPRDVMMRTDLVSARA